MKKIDVQIGDTIYEVDAAYRRGAEAHQKGVPYYCNPFRSGSYRHEQWNTGHCHEDDPETTLTALGVKA